MNSFRYNTSSKNVSNKFVRSFDGFKSSRQVYASTATAVRWEVSSHVRLEIGQKKKRKVKRNKTLFFERKTFQFLSFFLCNALIDSLPGLAGFRDTHYNVIFCKLIAQSKTHLNLSYLRSVIFSQCSKSNHIKKDQIPINNCANRAWLSMFYGLPHYSRVM